MKIDPFGLENLSQITEITDEPWLIDPDSPSDYRREKGGEEMPDKWWDTEIHKQYDFPPMNKKRRQIVIANMLRRPYYGTRLDKDLKDAKDRAERKRRGEG